MAVYKSVKHALFAAFNNAEHGSLVDSGTAKVCRFGETNHPGVFISGGRRQSGSPRFERSAQDSMTKNLLSDRLNPLLFAVLAARYGLDSEACRRIGIQLCRPDRLNARLYQDIALRHFRIIATLHQVIAKKHKMSPRRERMIRRGNYGIVARMQRWEDDAVIEAEGILKEEGLLR